MPPKSKPSGKARAPAKRKLAEEFPRGEVLTDTAKKQWILGEPIGQGGFGLLYLANENSSGTVGKDAPYVIKVVQVHGYGQIRYRFMVMDRFGTDLQKVFEENGKRFSRKTVLQLGLRLLDILEYIHEHEYVHADIKASNLLLSYKNPNLVYLVDYGLAYRYSPEGVLKEYKEDPKRCHDGTIEFTSIDAHKGVSPSRRSDLEILGYCMIQWLCGSLPWEDNLKDPNYVRDLKIKSRHNVSDFISKCFSTNDTPHEMIEYMEEVKSLEYNDKPSYQKLRNILQLGLKTIGSKDDDKLDFFISVNELASKSTKKKTKRKLTEVSEESGGDQEVIPTKQRRGRGRGQGVPSKTGEEGNPARGKWFEGKVTCPQKKIIFQKDSGRNRHSDFSCNWKGKRQA
ncbi:UNVERIFIED_CONTAM: hypothetical protein FKN15_030655 [Acipenser sinensis]